MNLTVFDKIDSYYKKKDKKEFFYTLLALILGIGFIMFYFITPKASSFADSNENKIHKFKGELRQSLIMLNGFKAQNIRIQKELKNLKKRVITLNKNKVFYSQLVNLLDFTHFDKEQWAQFVKSSIINAKIQGLDVEFVKNRFIDEESSLLKRIDSQIMNLKREIDNISDALFFIHNLNERAYYLKQEIELDSEISKLKKEKKQIIEKYSKKLINKKMIFGLTLRGPYKNFIYFMYQYENMKPLIRVENFKIEPPDRYYIEIHLYGYKL